MSISNSILLSLNIKDENIVFSENFVSEEKFRGVYSLVYEGTLSHDPPKICPVCGCVNEDDSIIKYGSKTCFIRLPAVSKKQAIFKLHKQRYL